MNDFLQQEFGLLVTDCKKLNGYDNINYLITTNKGKFIYKTYRYNDDLLDIVTAENAILLALKDFKTIDVPKPLAFADGSQIKIKASKKQTQICRALSFLEGQLFGDVTPTETLFQSLGIALARLNLKLQHIKNTSIKARQWEWDLQYFELNKPYLKDIANVRDRHVVLYFFKQFQSIVKPLSFQLRQQIIHNDANEWNILVNEDQVCGILDFGDLAHSFLINELAIAITYACYGEENPLPWACIILKSYHHILPLEEKEIQVLYYLIAARLCTSVCNSAHARKVNPNNNYATVSETNAWQMLYRWIAINPINAENTFRKAVGLPIKQPKPIAHLIKTRQQYISPIMSISYEQPISMTKSAFQYMYDAYGNTFLDAYNNIPHVGHCHPKVVDAGQQQMETLNTNTRYHYNALADYSEKLLSYFPSQLNRVFLVNSGSAASDLAIRIAQSYSSFKHIMVLESGYHGNTQIGIDISDYKFSNPKGQGQKPHIIKTTLPDTYRGKYDEDVSNAGERYGKDTVQQINNSHSPISAFIAEPIVGCAGQIPLAKGYLKEVYPVIRAQGGLCISDEVQTGFGRLGDYFWGFEAQGVVPDIVILGKPIANGHPMGAVVCSEKVLVNFENQVEFFSSFGGNPVSCAIAKSVLEVIEDEQLQQHAKTVGDYYKTQLKTLMKTYPCIGDVRGLGLFIGIDIVEPHSKIPDTNLAKHIKNELRNRHILVSTDGPYNNVIKTKPPLCFTKANVDRVVSEMEAVLKAYYN